MFQHYLAIIILLNLAFYIIFTVFYDFKLLKRENTNRNYLRPPTWENSLTATVTVLSSLAMWILFVGLPIIFLLANDLTNFYSLSNDLRIILNIIQILGSTVISTGTVIAFFGRKARGNDAVSWGVPDKLVTTGLFAYIRHPLYSSYCFYFLGFFLVFPSLITVLPMLGIYGYEKTASYEERILIDAFGDQYREYMKRTGKLFPKIR